MVIVGLREQCEVVADSKRAWADSTDERNRMMIELKAAGISDSKLIYLTGLSRSMVTKITAGARRSSALLD